MTEGAGVQGGDCAEATLGALRARLAAEGLHIVLPLGESSFDGVCGATGGPRLRALMPGAGAAVIVGDGGGDFFARFRAAVQAVTVGAQDAGAPADPLDDFTRLRVANAVAEALAPFNLAFRVLHPFVGRPGAGGDGDEPVLPFQRLGHAAGLPLPGPLGLQVHPLFGPWWAYRALVILPVALAAEPALPAPCAGCSGPCRDACPVAAPSLTGFDISACSRRRAADADADADAAIAGCASSCAARLACPVGAGARYPRAQLAFHMAASLRQLTRPTP